MEILVNNSQGTENRISGVAINTKDINLLNLDNKINDMRSVLNQICCTFDETEPNLKILSVSQCLDELIVEYMNEVNKD